MITETGAEMLRDVHGIKSTTAPGVDISVEAVEKQAAWHESRAATCMRGTSDWMWNTRTAQMLRALSSSATASGKPQANLIATAPKDGTEILGWRKDAGWMLIRWDAPENFCTEKELEGLDEDSREAYGWFYADFVAGGRLEGSEEPTHWMYTPGDPT